MDNTESHTVGEMEHEPFSRRLDNFELENLISAGVRATVYRSPEL
jgi:hypothetical protein